MENAFKMRFRKGEGVSKKGPLIAKHPSPSSSINSSNNTGHLKELRSPVGPTPPSVGYNRRRQLSPDSRTARRNQQTRGSPKESPKTSPTRAYGEGSSSPINQRRHVASNRYNARPGTRTPPSPVTKRYTPPTSPRTRRHSPNRIPQPSPTMSRNTRSTPLKSTQNSSIPSASTSQADKKPPSPANSRPSSPGSRRPASPRGNSPRGRGASPGSKPPPISEEDLQIRVQRAHKARLYLLHQTGPNSFSVGSDAPNHKYKVIIGPQSCSCGHGPYCVHVLFVMVRVLQLSDKDSLLMAGSLKDYEVEQLLRSWENRRKKAIHARERRNGQGVMKDKFLSRHSSRNGRTPPGSPTGPSPDSSDASSDTDAQCPICLMTMVTGEHLVSCDAGCQNFLHHHCMSIWAADRNAQGQPLFCPLCRAPWSSKFNPRFSASSRERKNSFVATSPRNSIRKVHPKMSASFSGAATNDKRNASGSTQAMSRSLLAYPQSNRSTQEYSSGIRNLVAERFTGQCYPPTVRGEITAALIHNTTEEMVLLPYSEPIPEELESTASAWVAVFGNELIACLCSRDWAVRETGLRRLAHEVVKVLRWDYLVTTEEMRQKVVHCSANILAQVAIDPVYKVYIACLRCVKLLLAHLSPTEEREVIELQDLFRPLIHTLLLKCADGNRRTSQISIDFLVELARGQSGELALGTQSGDIVETAGLGDISYVLSCLIDKSPPTEAPWQWLLGRLCVLDRLLDEFPHEFQLNLADPFDKHFKVRHYARLMSVVEFAFKALCSNHATVSKLARRIYICSARMAILQPSVFNQICSMLTKLDVSLQTRLKRRLLSIHTHSERKGSIAKLGDKISLYNSQGRSSNSKLARSISHSPSHMLSSTAKPEVPLNCSPKDNISEFQTYEKPSSPKRPTHLPLNCFDVKFKEKQAKLRLYHKTRAKQEVPLLVQHALLSPGANQLDMQQLDSILKGEEIHDSNPLTPNERKYVHNYFIKDAIRTPITPSAPYPTPVGELTSEQTLDVTIEKEELLPSIPGLDIIPKYLEEDVEQHEQCFETTYEEGRDWVKGPLLGTGAFSSCFQARDFHTGTIMAVKQLSVSRNSEEKQERVEAAIEEEILMMSRLRHKNIIRLLGATRVNNSFSLFSEWMAGGSVATMLDKYGPFSETVIIKYTKQVLHGLQYLHDNMILHRDLKGANLLIDSTGQILRIGDFGTAARLANKSTITGEFQGQLLGTIAFMAPEVLKGEDYGRACDVWSVGCCIIEMATTKPPWGADNVSNQYKLMFRIATSGTPPPIPENLSNETRDITLKCLQVASVKRPTPKALLKHDVFDLEPP